MRQWSSIYMGMTEVGGDCMAPTHAAKLQQFKAGDLYHYHYHLVCQRQRHLTGTKHAATLWPRTEPNRTELNHTYDHGNFKVTWGFLTLLFSDCFAGSLLVTGLHLAHLPGEADSPLEERGDELDQRVSVHLHELLAHRVPHQWHRIRLFDHRECDLHIYHGHNRIEN